ncbi:MAG: cobalamin biosynthesis protein CobD/CbiB, partial [Paracoccus sp. (in: a-proteobacteria)]
ENASDGVVAPLFWAAVAGLPGIAAYKAINTLDSMIGHRTPRHAEFGRFAARLDDAANWAPARLTALLFTCVAGGTAWRTARRDARAHRSPNAGWPEAAMAGALGLRLSGPRIYGGRVAEEPWLNGAGRDPVAADIARALAICRRALWLGAGLLTLLSAI